MPLAQLWNGGGSIDPHDLLESILGEAVRLTAATSASLCLVDEEEGTLRIAISAGMDDAVCEACRLPIGTGITGWVAANGRPLLVPDVSRDSRYVALLPGVRSELAVPLESDGRVIGVINVDSEREDAFSEESAKLLESLAVRSADTIAYARLYEEVRTTNAGLAAILDVGRELTSILEVEQVLTGIVRHARHLLGGKLASLLLEKGGRFETVAADGAGAAYLSREPPDLQTSRVGDVVQTGLPLVVDDVQEDPRFRLTEVAETEGLRGLLSVPLRTKERVLGVLNVYSGERRRFRRHDITLLTLLAQHSAIAVENASLLRQAREARENLRESEKLAALGRLSAGLAHELRNPLNTLAVLLYAMIEDHGGCSLSDLRVVDTEIRRMSLLLDQFLDFARPRSPQFRRERVEEVLAETVMLISPEAGKKGIHVEPLLPKALPRVWADGNQLKQVFLNLALNALQAMPDGGKLVVEARPASGAVVVEIRDTGEGIPLEAKERLFEPFFTTRRGGTGLGLPIALRIVEAHSGDLELHSEPGKGTVASVWLPV